MRKTIAVILLLALVFSTHAFAEALYVTSLSLDELVLLRQQITTEINSRIAGANDIFYPADYTVGTHLPAGTYVVTIVEVFDKTDDRGKIAVWAEGMTQWDCRILQYCKAGMPIFVDLAQGDTLRIKNCSVTIVPYALPTF